MTKLYVYFKGHEKVGVWKSIDGDRIFERASNDEDIGFTTVLQVSECPDSSGSVSDDALYQGPLYLDFDSDELDKSIKATRSVIEKLIVSGVHENAIQIWATGKRGFHVLIPQSVFSADIPVNKLPRIYRQMVLALNVPKELDRSVYSCGRGRMWRWPGRKRLDNGLYKVPITLSELRKIDADSYHKFCSAPRTEIQHKTNPPVSSFLQQLYVISAKRAEKEKTPDAVFIDPLMKAELDGLLPPCLDDLKNGQNLKGDKGFNDFSIQFAKGVASFAERGESKDLIAAFAENIPGMSYNTPAKRKTHCTNAYNIATKRASYEWSCASMLSVLETRPCATCKIKDSVYNVDQKPKAAGTQKAPARKSAEAQAEPETVTIEMPKDAGAFQAGGFTFESPEAMHSVFAAARAMTEAQPEIAAQPEAQPEIQQPKAKPAKKAKEPEPEIEDETEEAEDEEPELQVEENYMVVDNCMCFLTAEGVPRRIANFYMRITDIFLEYIENIKQDRRVALKADVIVGRSKVGSVIIEELAWNAKATFIGVFSGISNLAYYGKDDDHQRLKSALMGSMDNNATEIRRVYSTGIVRQRINGVDMMTYVEPGWSVDQAGMQDLYTISGKVQAAPDLKNTPMAESGDRELKHALSHMMRMNQPFAIAELLGWYMACFLKQHIFAFNNEFPLLNVNGEAGAGKTQTACAFAALNGVNYFSESPLVISTTTDFPIWKFIESSTTVPRIFDEFNKSKMPRTYDRVSEYLKQSYNQLAISRGHISSIKAHGVSRTGAATMDIPLTGPIVVLSEQSIQAPALRERTIQVSLSKNQRNNEQMTESFEEFKSAAMEGVLMPFAKTANMEAICLTVDQVKDWMRQFRPLIPKVIDDRPRYSFAVILLGLEFFRYVCNRLNLRLDEQIAELRENFMAKLISEQAGEFLVRQRSEVDIVMDKLGIMSALTSAGGIAWLEKRKHYLRTENQLLIDISLAHALYVRYVRTMENTAPVIDNASELKNLLRNESYCISLDLRMEGFSKGRPVAQLDTAKMKAKGIDIEQFEKSTMG